MPLTLKLLPSVERRLAEKAAAAGKSVEVYAEGLIEEAVSPPAREKTFAEIAEPFRVSFEESGMTEEELDALVKEARAEVRAEWRRRKTP